MAYCIDLDARKIQILEFSGTALKDDLKFYSVLKATDLNTWDRRVFNTLDQALNFITKYSRIYTFLDNSNICKNKKLPSLRYKRRYIVLTLMGLKTETFRSYNKNWKAGQLINLQDQTYFLTVKIISITKIKNEYCYKFEVVK